MELCEVKYSHGRVMLSLVELSIAMVELCRVK